MFRGNWAVAGNPLVDCAEVILHNQKFLEAAKARFGTSLVHSSFVFVNVNAPMPASPRHVDIPCFHGATREQYPLPFLQLMGRFGLFEAWRVIQAGPVAWFYEGTGGSFDYWPEGPDGPMLSEQAPFGNVALMADKDRMYPELTCLRLMPGAALLGTTYSQPHLAQLGYTPFLQSPGTGQWFPGLAVVG